MSRQSKRPQPISKSALRSAAEAPAEGTSLWPAEFASLSRTLVIAAVFLGYALLLYVFAGLYDLMWAKRLMAYALGFGNPFDVVAGSNDLAGVLFVLGAVVAGCAVHPVIGLVVLFLVRPWLDGYTYPTDNLYFLWVLLAMTGWWALRVFRAGVPVRHGKSLLLIGAFFVIALLSAGATIQYDNTFRQLLYLILYAALYLLVTNTAVSRTTRSILLAGLLASVFVQAVYAVLHFEYLLPFMRKMVQDPRMLRHFFGTDTLTPELARRFEINRAFGSLLFPNALAAFLILGIPYTLFGTLSAWRDLGPAWRDKVRADAGDVRRRRHALALAACTWFTLFLGGLGTLTFIAGYQPEDAQLGATGIFGLAALLSLVPAAAVWWCTQQYGAQCCGAVARAIVLPVAALTLLFTLWITYSRGGLLALAIALGGTLALVWMTPKHWAALTRCMPGRRAAAVCLVAGMAGALLVTTVAPPWAAAQDAPAPAAKPHGNRADVIDTVTEEGRSVSLGAMADPESFLLRLTYWRVGLSMFADNPFLGVGLGNFKVAYPHYQYLGAGHVKEAHNGYLQLFCETGLLGGFWWLGVCGLFLVWGARRIVHAGDSRTRLGLAGLYAGIVALLLHAGIDIDLSHPTLVMFLVAFVGLFVGMAADAEGVPGEETGAAAGTPLLGLAIMVVCALVLGLSTRVYLQDLALSRISLINVGSRQEMTQRLQLGTVLLQDVLGTIWDKNRPLRRIPVSEALKLVPDMGKLRTAGDVYAPDPSGKEEYKLVGRNQQVPPDSFLVLLRPGLLINALQASEKGWLPDVERADQRFPHAIDVAMYMARWYSLMVNATSLPGFEIRPDYYRERLAYWAEACAQRSPMLADAQLSAAESWWALAKVQQGAEQRATFERALAAYAEATELNTISGDYNEYYGQALKAMADAMAAAGEADTADRYRSMAEAQIALGKERQHQRWIRGL